jgi:hypothetical protein
LQTLEAEKMFIFHAGIRTLVAADITLMCKQKTFVQKFSEFGNEILNVRFEVFTAVTMKNGVF